MFRFALALVAALAVLFSVAPAGFATTEVYYEVPGPVGGTPLESLPDIARVALGDEARWPEILELNKTTPQPGGTALTGPESLRGGTLLVLPAGARAGEIRLQPLPEVPQAAPTAAPVAADDKPVVVVGAGIAVVLLAGGALLFRRRRRDRPATPPRVTVDDALRQLVRDLPADGRAAPGVYAAVVGEEQISVLLAPARPQAPEPWQARHSGTEWSLSTRDLVRSTTPPAYPLLVPVGFVGGAWTAVNLGRAAGIISLHGAQDDVVSAVESMVRGVHPSVDIVTVGILPAMALPAPRVRAFDTLPQLFATPLSAHGQLVIIEAVELTPSTVDQLNSLAARSDHSTAVLVLGAVPHAAWQLEIGPDLVPDLGGLGLHLDHEGAST
jgi:LPXTG-motif cell wall-anchored protein